MDSAFKTAPYPACTTAQLRDAVAAGRGNPVMLAELERREKVAAGDRSVMTDGERLRVVRAEHARQELQLLAKSPMRRPVAQDDVDGLGLFDAVRSPAFL